MNTQRTLLSGILLGCALVFWAGGLVAAEDDRDVPGLVAVFSEIRAAAGTDFGRARLEELQADATFTKNREEMESLRKEITSQLELAQRESETLSNQEKQEILGSVQDKQADFQHVSKKLETAQQQLVQQLLQEQAQRMGKVLEEIVKERDITLLLRQDAVSYATPVHDVTSAVIERLNASSPDKPESSSKQSSKSKSSSKRKRRR